MAGNVEANLKSLGCDVISYLRHSGTKTRLIDQRTRQHLVRIDKTNYSKESITEWFSLGESFIRGFIRGFDAIVVSDYNKGFLTSETLRDIDKAAAFLNIPMFVDTKKTDLSIFKHAVVKINESERNAVTGLCANIIVTMGDKGVIWQDKKFNVPAITAFDVCGAGDTFLASLTYQYLITKSIDKAIEFAIKAAALTVQHVGVYAPTLKEIQCV